MIFSRFFHRFSSQPIRLAPAAVPDEDVRANHKLIYEEIKGYAAHQASQMDSLDNKAALVAATATALTGGFLALTNSDNASNRREFYLSLHVRGDRFALLMSPHTLHFLLYLLAFIAYGIVGYNTYRASRLEDWRVVPSPKRLLDHYWDNDVDDMFATLAASLEAACTANQPRIDYKRKWLARSYVALGVQLVILSAATLIGAWHNLL